MIISINISEFHIFKCNLLLDAKRVNSIYLYTFTTNRYNVRELQD
jgi:hypothetical protein